MVPLDRRFESTPICLSRHAIRCVVCSTARAIDAIAGISAEQRRDAIEREPPDLIVTELRHSFVRRDQPLPIVPAAHRVSVPSFEKQIRAVRDQQAARILCMLDDPAERSLGPMSSIDRRIIHLRLQDEPGVTTRSEGEEPYRYVVVEPA